MPFTFAHPALVLPLMKLPKKWFSITGLMVGSIVPDFENIAFRWKMGFQLCEFGNIIVSILSSFIRSLIITTFLLSFAKRDR